MITNPVGGRTEWAVAVAARYALPDDEGDLL
jgi:hypothetical protein